MTRPDHGLEVRPVIRTPTEMQVVPVLVRGLAAVEVHAQGAARVQEVLPVAAMETGGLIPSAHRASATAIGKVAGLKVTSIPFPTRPSANTPAEVAGLAPSEIPVTPTVVPRVGTAHAVVLTPLVVPSGPHAVAVELVVLPTTADHTRRRRPTMAVHAIDAAPLLGAATLASLYVEDVVGPQAGGLGGAETAWPPIAKRPTRTDQVASETVEPNVPLVGTIRDDVALPIGPVAATVGTPLRPAVRRLEGVVLTHLAVISVPKLLDTLVP